MRVLALDIGEKRVGVAISDPAAGWRRRSRSSTRVEASRPAGKLRTTRRGLRGRTVVVGLPLSMDGTEGPQARRVREVAERLARFLPVPMEFVDERLSSAEAKRRMREAGHDERSQRGVIDMVAAAIFLQDYLDAATDHPQARDERDSNEPSAPADIGEERRRTQRAVALVVLAGRARARRRGRLGGVCIAPATAVEPGKPVQVEIPRGATTTRDRRLAR